MPETTPAKPRRNRASAKAAGSKFERLVADYLNTTVDDRIDRRPKTGAKDRGDIGGLRQHGDPVVIECKDTTRWDVAGWLAEAETERGNDDAIAALVVAKRRGVADPGQQLVMMTVADLVALLTGERPAGGDQ